MKNINQVSEVAQKVIDEKRFLSDKNIKNLDSMDQVDEEVDVFSL